MYSTMKLLAAATLIATATAHAQTPERALLTTTPIGYGIGHASGATDSRKTSAPVFDAAGERALLGRVENPVSRTDSPRGTGTPIDGARALMGKSSQAVSIAPRSRSAFVASLDGSTGGDISGEAEFGPVSATDASTTFVISLGTRGEQSAILFTRTAGGPLGVGRYRISDQGSGADEILALVMTGTATDPTGVFRGRSGWLVVTAASDSLLTGRFYVDGVGFVAAEPEAEDRPMIATGSFSALAAY